jgi:hypothetical protein
MRLVDYLKMAGAVTVPDDVIRRAYGSKERVEGSLSLTKLPSGSVLMTFAPNLGVGASRPLVAKDSSQAQADLAGLFGLSDAEARAEITVLEKQGQAEVAVSVDESLAPELFLDRS